MPHTFLVALLGLAFFVAATAPASAAPELTADEIVAKSQAAMAPPIQYRMVMGGVDSIVSTKDLGGENGIATRVETVNPILEQTAIATAKYAYEWQPKTGLAIDKTLLGEAMMAQAAALKQAVPAGATMRLLKSELIDGAEHYVIETTYPQGLIDAVTKMLSIATPFSGKVRSWINTGNFQLRRMTNPTGEMQYLDIKQGIDLPNELFLPPEGMTFQKPTTQRRYLEIITNAMTPKPIPREKIEPRIIAPPFWDPVAKTWKASAPPGWDQKEWEAHIDSLPRQTSELEKQAQQTTEPTKSYRSWLLYGNLAILAALVTYAYVRRRGAKAAFGDPK